MSSSNQSCAEKSPLWLAAKDGRLLERPERAGAVWRESSRTFRVLWQGKTLAHPWLGPWGDSFFGDFTAAQIADILAAFDASGAFLTCWVLDAELGEEGRELLHRAFEGVADAGYPRVGIAFPVPPAMFAAGNGLLPAVQMLLANPDLDADPDRVIDGCVSAFAGATLHGNRLDIVSALLKSKPNVESVAEAIEILSEELQGRLQPEKFPAVETAVVRLLQDASGSRE